MYVWSGFLPICTCWWYSGSNFTHATHVQGNCSCIDPFCASHSLTLNASLAEAITFSIDLFTPALILLALPLIHNHNLLKGLSRATRPELDSWSEHLKSMPCLFWPQLYLLLPRCPKSTDWTKCIWSLYHFLYMQFQVLGLCYSWKNYRLRSNYSWDYITSKSIQVTKEDQIYMLGTNVHLHSNSHWDLRGFWPNDTTVFKGPWQSAQTGYWWRKLLYLPYSETVHVSTERKRSIGAGNNWTLTPFFSLFLFCLFVCIILSFATKKYTPFYTTVEEKDAGMSLDNYIYLHFYTIRTLFAYFWHAMPTFFSTVKVFSCGILRQLICGSQCFWCRLSSHYNRASDSNCVILKANSSEKLE